jgi:hypothetical protein
VGKEAEERCIDLPEDDPEMIRRLIAYIYLGEYDPVDEHSVAMLATLNQPASTSDTSPTYHLQYRASSVGDIKFYTHCRCLAPRTNHVEQSLLKAEAQSAPHGYLTVEKPANAFQIANPLIAHATMYALGDKYQVEGLCELAKRKFESCLPNHAQFEDFITATQLAYGSTPDSNRGLRDAVLGAFRMHFAVDLTQISGAESKLHTIAELSFLLLKSWPVKTEQPIPAAPNPVGVFGLPRPAATNPDPNIGLFRRFATSASVFNVPQGSFLFGHP